MGEWWCLTCASRSELQTCPGTRRTDFELRAIPVGAFCPRACRNCPSLTHRMPGATTAAAAAGGLPWPQGFAHVANIAGGIDAWATELDTTVARY